MKNKLLNALFFILVLGLTIHSIFSGVNLKEVFLYIKQADGRYITFSILCVICYIMGESVCIWYLLRITRVETQFTHCCLYSFIGFFYSCITPSASGGQPMQIIAMRKDHIPVGVSFVVLAIVTITYKMVLVLIGAIIIIIRPPELMLYLVDVLWIMYLGMALNVICVAVILILVFDPNLVRLIANKSSALLVRIHLIQNPHSFIARIENILNQYHGTAAYFRQYKTAIIHVLLITLIQRITLFSITWLTYLALNLNGTPALTIITLQAMISVAVDMLPLPGGMGISESLFLNIFLPIFGKFWVIAGMVISRGISYYTQLFISGIMTILATVILKRKRKPS